MCLFHKAFLGLLANKATGFLPFCFFQTDANNLIPTLKKENHSVSAMSAGFLHLATGTFGLAVLTFCRFFASVLNFLIPLQTACGTTRTLQDLLPRLLNNSFFCDKAFLPDLQLLQC